MPCFHPMTAYRSRSGRDPKTGKWSLVFNIAKGYSDMAVTVPCGQCIGCRLERSRQWAIRCVHEASLWQDNCFITLTYNDQNLPYARSFDPETGEVMPSLPTLFPREFQLFMKRLRKKCGNGIRFFMCGEYGEKYQRPHYHAIIFNYDFPDRRLWKVQNGVPLYNSDILERLWTYGFSTIGDVTFESAAYVARYITKKITGADSYKHYRGRVPEFTNQSRRPGIARQWFDKFYTDVYPSDSCVVRPGMIARPPKYYDKIYDLHFGDEFSRIKARRIRMAKLSSDNTFERLAVRERIQLVKFDKLIRTLD